MNNRIVLEHRFGPPLGCYNYELYGIPVRSEIPLAVLDFENVSEPDVTFSKAKPGRFECAIAGLDNLNSSDDWYERYRSSDGFDLLRWQSLFDFVVSPDGRSIACGLLEHGTIESFQLYLLGHVLSYALVKQGHEPLHATTVVVDGKAIAFLGESGRGKSTLAAAFLENGHQLLTDDLLLIRRFSGALCGFPGPPRIKLYPEIGRHFLSRQASSTSMNAETDKLIIPLESHQRHAAPAPIRGLVVLDEAPSDVASVHLTRMLGTKGLMELARATFNPRVAGPARMERQLVTAREWMRHIPIWRLSYGRTIANLGRVQQAILSQVLGSQEPGS
jgi:hypothetical protein